MNPNHMNPQILYDVYVVFLRTHFVDEVTKLYPRDDAILSRPSSSFLARVSHSRPIQSLRTESAMQFTFKTNQQLYWILVKSVKLFLDRRRLGFIAYPWDISAERWVLGGQSGGFDCFMHFGDET